MTKEITKSNILQELEDKFKLREHIPESFLFGETVVPTYDIAQHVHKWTTEYGTVNITSASAFTLFTVPDTERWHVRGYNVIFMGSGAIKVTGIYINRIAAPTRFMYLDMTLNQTVSYAVNLPTVVTLNPADRLLVLCDDYTSTQELRAYIDVMKEEIR